MPWIRVWPVSSSDSIRKVGSSSPRRCRALPIFSWSAFVFGSIATAITVSGNSMLSSAIGASGAARVSPVPVSLRPTPAQMSPA